MGWPCFCASKVSLVTWPWSRRFQNQAELARSAGTSRWQTSKRAGRYSDRPPGYEGLTEKDKKRWRLHKHCNTLYNMKWLASFTVTLPVWACISSGISVRRGCVCWCSHQFVTWELQSWNAALKGTSGCSVPHFDTSCPITSGLWMPAYRRPSTENTASPDSVR